MPRHRIVLAREQYKFSCAHMTVFADGTKERLHGHNYTIAVAIEVDRVDLAAMIPFAPIKSALADLCAAWKEHLLVAANNPFLEIIRDDDELELKLCGERYVMPRQDALLLPIDNVSVEALAAHIAALLRERIESPGSAGARSDAPRRGGSIAPLDASHVVAIEVTVAESPGQGASCELSLR